MANESGSAFARDLGYLDKFFVSIQSFADTLPEAEGDRLRALMGEEVKRWAEIRDLLGASPAPKAAESAPASQAPVVPVAPPPAIKAEPVPPRPAAEAKPPSRPGFTVGSLYGQPKK